MKNLKRVLAVLLLFIMTSSVASAEDTLEFSFSEVNPDYEKYMANQNQPMLMTMDDEQSTETESSYVPSYYISADPLYALGNTDETLPVKYDAREHGRITSVENQGKDGVCWTFAGNSSLEAALMPEREFNFSEQHVRFALSSDNENKLGYDRHPNDGGNFRMYAAYLMRWSGPVLESDDPYDLSTESRPVSVTDSFEEQFHVQGYMELPNPSLKVEDVSKIQKAAHVNLVKQYVMEYGSVSTSIYYDSKYLDKDTCGYYYNDKNYYNTMYQPSNHALSIVGWDDTYSKENFKNQPENDGAFIIKNSWGEGFGDNGYFYLSYEDAYAGWEASVITRVDEKDRYDNIYQYDPFCLSGAFGYREVLTNKILPQACYANVFTVEKIGEEFLQAVSVYVTANDVKCSVYFSDDGELKEFSKMKKIGQAEFDIPGYYTIDLAESIPLEKEKFAIAVQVNSDISGQNMIPLEMPLKSGAVTTTNCKANAGESFVSYDSKQWQDLTTIAEDSNILMKAYTKDLPKETQTGFSDEKGKIKTGWNNGDTIKADTYYHNEEASPVKAKVLLGLYQDNCLIKLVSSDEQEIQPGKSGHFITDSFQIPQTGEYTIRQFVWETEHILPLIPGAYLEKQTKTE